MNKEGFSSPLSNDGWKGEWQMTIISSVFVPEGIVLAADSRLTGIRKTNEGTEWFTLTDNAQKLILLKSTSIGISSFGDATIEGKTVSDFLRLFEINQVIQDDTIEVVARKLKKYLHKNYSNYDVAFTVAGYNQDEPFVYFVNKSEYIRKNSDENNNLYYGAYWNGEHAAFSKLVKETPLNFDLMPLKDAVDFSEFVVDTTIKYYRFSDQISTCGGAIDVLVITKDGAKFYKHKLFK